jgi:hypothetical protein
MIILGIKSIHKLMNINSIEIGSLIKKLKKEINLIILIHLPALQAVLALV